MKIVFCSTMFPDAERDIKKSKRPDTVSGHKYQENLLNGLIENGCDVMIINTPRIRHYPDYPQIIFRKKPFQQGRHTVGIHIGFINLFGISYLTQAFNIFLSLCREIKRHKTEKYVLVVYNSHLHALLATRAIKRFYPRVVLCNSIGDLHGVYGASKKPSGLHDRFVNGIGYYQDKAATKFDTFVFATKYMAKVLQVEKKPHVIVECFYKNNENDSNIKQTNTSEKVIFYAGALNADYGIEHLLRAFKLIEKQNYHLQIAGIGETENIIRDCAEKDPRIEYLGFITPQEVENHQRAATVLINPRTSDHEYVKYSFPSKTMEGLASGKPYIAHRLPCDPPEYGEYIQYAAAETDKALRDKIVEICEFSAEERDRIGRMAREFILKEKNPTVMCRRIVDMWEEVCNCIRK